MDFPIKNGGSFQFAMLVHQRVIDPHKIAHQAHLAAVQVTLVANEHDDLSTSGTATHVPMAGDGTHCPSANPKATELLAAIAKFCQFLIEFKFPMKPHK